MEYHIPVLLKEAVEHLKVKKGGKYIDCTLGDGGHTLEILKLGGEVLAIDRDIDSIKRAEERIKTSEKVKIVNDNYKNISQIAKSNNFFPVDGILYDLGVSTNQLKDMDRGFSFESDAPLDMRMDKTLNVTAGDLVNGLYEKELSDVIYRFGGEGFANRIARAIVKARKENPIVSCRDLAKVVERAIPLNRGKIHKATKTFQALRIAVNNELEDFSISLSQAVSLLIPGGKLVVISFHCLEDEIVDMKRPELKEIETGVIVPSHGEVEVNNRARSAKMRVYSKV